MGRRPGGAVNTNSTEIGFILERLDARGDAPAIFWKGKAVTACDLARSVRDDVEWLTTEGVEPGSVVLLRGDYSPRTVSLLLACIERRTILAPLLPTTLSKTPGLRDIVDPGFEIDAASADGPILSRRAAQPAPHDLVGRLRGEQRPGLILFTSGSTGEPKGVVHDFGRLLTKFHVRRPAMRTINFLLFDHWGGLNTLLHCLANSSPVVLPENRTPDNICRLLEDHRIELLPASPTFLNMLLLSNAYAGRDLSALRVITYGSEPMPQSTLTGLRAAFPGVDLRQTYGLIELGVLRAKSLSSDSLWVKVGGEGYDVRIVDGLLQIKADSAMLGYLNAPSPFTEDGYFMTGDRVELNGEYLRILGRESELINVGGQKVFPAEVEGVLLECDLVEEAIVYGERHPLTGKIVCADVQLRGSNDDIEARRVIKRFCAERLEPFKIPVKLRFVSGGLHSDRMKRLRIGRTAAGATTDSA
jgi:long-chain acyl-CoA synthetase